MYSKRYLNDHSFLDDSKGQDEPITASDVFCFFDGVNDVYSLMPEERHPVVSRVLRQMIFQAMIFGDGIPWFLNVLAAGCKSEHMSDHELCAAEAAILKECAAKLAAVRASREAQAAVAKMLDTPPVIRT